MRTRLGNRCDGAWAFDGFQIMQFGAEFLGAIDGHRYFAHLIRCQTTGTLQIGGFGASMG